MVRPRRGGGLLFTGCGTARSASRKDLSGSGWRAVAAKEHDSGACAGTGHKDENAFFQIVSGMSQIQIFPDFFRSVPICFRFLVLPIRFPPMCCLDSLHDYLSSSFCKSCCDHVAWRKWIAKIVLPQIRTFQEKLCILHLIMYYLIYDFPVIMQKSVHCQMRAVPE
jgi:hypothetical protein